MIEIHLLRTDSKAQDFISLVAQLDAELAIRDGEDHAFFHQFNSIEALNQVVLAMHQGKALGCGAIKSIGEDTMEVKRMYVSPTARGNGIAFKILQELERWAFELGCFTCRLETGLAQAEAIGLYTKSGYTRVPNYDQYIGVESSRCFEKRLSPKS